MSPSAAAAPAPAGGSEEANKPAALQTRTSVGSSVWLKPDRFAEPDFSPDLCVADLRRYVPLPTVKAELQTYLVHLRNKLVEALNEDYGDYVGLSSRLTGLEGAVVRMRQPLLDIQGKLSSVQDAIKAELQALQQGLLRRQDAAAARATLELMQEVAASTSKVEKLLEEVAAVTQQQQQGATAAGPAAAAAAASGAGAADGPAAAAGGGDAELSNRCRLLVRVAGEAARLLFLVDRGKHLAFVASLERRVSSCRLALDRQLQAALLAALAARDWAAASNCLRGYLEVGQAARGEEGLASGLVAPLVRRVVAEVRQQQLAAPGGGSGGGAALTAVVERSLGELHEEAGPLLTALLAPGGGMAGLDVLGAVLLGELSTAVADGMPGVFSPGNPAAFQSAFLAGQALLGRLEGLAGSRAAVERLRASGAAAAWSKRWNLAVYFSLIYQDVAGTFEAAVRAPQLQQAADSSISAALPEGSPPLQLAVSACLWGCLQRAVAPQVFLLQLADRFTRLIAQLLVRYDTWLQDIHNQRQAAAAAAAAGPAGQPGSTAGAAAGALGPAPPAPAAADGAATADATGPAAWAASLPADACAAIAADAAVIQGLVSGPFAAQLRELLSGLPGEVTAAASDMLVRLASRISQHAQQVLLLVGGDVLERCMATVRQLKGITATYRMTAKGPPVRHSHYVAGVLQPLRQLLDAPGPVQRLPDGLKLLLSRDVIDGVNTRYNSLAEELLTSVKKTESSLKRLKKARPGEAPDAAGGAAMSDSDKISMQLHLDVQEHGRQIERFGLVAAELESFRQLLATVTPASDQAGLQASEQQPAQPQQPPEAL